MFSRIDTFRKSLLHRRHSKRYNTLFPTDDDVNAADQDGNTALHLAAKRGRYYEVRTLLEKNAHIHSKNNEGADAFMLAAFHGHIKIVKLLLEAGADVFAQNGDSSTAYQLAEEQMRPDIGSLIAQNMLNRKNVYNSSLKHDAPRDIKSFREPRIYSPGMQESLNPTIDPKIRETPPIVIYARGSETEAIRTSTRLHDIEDKTIRTPPLLVEDGQENTLKRCLNPNEGPQQNSLSTGKEEWSQEKIVYKKITTRSLSNRHSDEHYLTSENIKKPKVKLYKITRLRSSEILEENQREITFSGDFAVGDNTLSHSIQKYTSYTKNTKKEIDNKHRFERTQTSHISTQCDLQHMSCQMITNCDCHKLCPITAGSDLSTSQRTAICDLSTSNQITYCDLSTSEFDLSTSSQITSEWDLSTSSQITSEWDLSTSRQIMTDCDLGIESQIRTECDLGTESQIMTDCDLSSSSQIMTDCDLITSQLTTESDLSTTSQKTTESNLGTSQITTEGDLGTTSQITTEGDLGTTSQLATEGDLGTTSQLTTEGDLGTKSQITTEGNLSTTSQLTTDSDFFSTSHVTTASDLNQETISISSSNFREFSADQIIPTLLKSPEDKSSPEKTNITENVKWQSTTNIYRSNSVPAVLNFLSLYNPANQPGGQSTTNDVTDSGQVQLSRSESNIHVTVTAQNVALDGSIIYFKDKADH